jgi:hypothetical protein
MDEKENNEKNKKKGREDNKNLNDWCQLICANNTSTTKSIVNKATIKASHAHFQGNVSCETFHEIEIKFTFSAYKGLTRSSFPSRFLHVFP